MSEEVSPPEMLREYLGDPEGLALVQHRNSWKTPTLCMAEDHCLQRNHDKGTHNSRTTMMDFRIRVLPVPRRGRDGSETGSARRVIHYHLECFELLARDYLLSLILRKLKLDGPGWGFMIRKWMRHRGAIDRDRIGEYTDEYEVKEDRESLINPTVPHPRTLWCNSDHTACPPDHPCTVLLGVSAGQELFYLRDLSSRQNTVLARGHAGAHPLPRTERRNVEEWSMFGALLSGV